MNNFNDLQTFDFIVCIIKEINEMFIASTWI